MRFMTTYLCLSPRKLSPECSNINLELFFLRFQLFVSLWVNALELKTGQEKVCGKQRERLTLVMIDVARLRH